MCAATGGWRRRPRDDGDGGLRREGWICRYSTIAQVCVCGTMRGVFSSSSLLANPFYPLFFSFWGQIVLLSCHMSHVCILYGLALSDYPSFFVFFFDKTVYRIINSDLEWFVIFFKALTTCSARTRSWEETERLDQHNLRLMIDEVIQERTHAHPKYMSTSKREKKILDQRNLRDTHKNTCAHPLAL